MLLKTREAFALQDHPRRVCSVLNRKFVALLYGISSEKHARFECDEFQTQDTSVSLSWRLATK
jgi:hypothetical protein